MLANPGTKLKYLADAVPGAKAHLHADGLLRVARLDGGHQGAQLVKDLRLELASIHAPEQRADLLAVVLRLALLACAWPRVGDDAPHQLAQSRDYDLILCRHLHLQLTRASSCLMIAQHHAQAQK